MRSRLGIRSSIAPVVAFAVAIVFSFGVVSPASAGRPSGGGNGKGKRDTTPPSVSIANPANGATVSGTIIVSGSASDNAGVSSVAVKVDAGSAQAASGTTSWSRAIDTTAYADGSHTITATATDPSGNAGSVSVTITIGNAAPDPDPTPTPTPTPTPEPTGTPVAAPTLQPGSIGGWAYKDLNRNGVYETTDQPFAGHHLYLFSGTGSYLGQAYSDAAGWYVFSGRADGDYRVEYDSSTWSPLKHDWVPTTTGSAWPRRTIHLAGTARADFGWRTITWSTDPNAPVATYTGPTGLRVQAYNDAVAPVEIYNMVTTGTVGSEASRVTIRFALGSVSATSTSVVSIGGVYQDFSATASVSYDAWLETAGFTVGHEYGHAWSWYYAFIVQQDETMSGYLSARGLSGDPRVGSSYEWGVGELIAEDYRQLLGPPAGRSTPQANTAIPPASQVPGLAEYLATTFTQPPA